MLKLKKPGRKNIVLFYLFVVLSISFLFILLSVIFDYYDSIYSFLHSFKDFSGARLFINLGFLFLAASLFLLYRGWRLNENKKKELEDIIESITPYTLMVMDSDMRIATCTKSSKRLLGYEAEEILDKEANMLFSGGQDGKGLNELIKNPNPDDSYTGAITGKKKNGEPIFLEITAANLKLHNGMVALLSDITEQKKKHETLLSLQKAVENMQIGVTIADPQGKILYCNPAEAELHGFQAEDLIGKDVSVFGLPEKRKPLSEKELKALKRFRRESVNIRKDGTSFPVQLMSDVVMDGEGNVIGIVTTSEDISERKQNEETIKQIAFHDSLTGLPNRTLFNTLLKQALARARRYNQELVIMFIDIDRFKVINDTFGHSVGDQLIQAVASRLTATIRESDMVCRLGGDEFIIAISDGTDPQSASTIAKNILNKLSRIFILNKKEIYVTASIGISVFPLDGNEIDTLVKNADTAMYKAKEQGRNNYQFYRAEFNAGAVEKLTMENNLRKAVRQKEFLLHYQPQVDIPTGKIVAAEALMRWDSKEFGLINPEHFIAMAEETGLILPIGDFVLHTACAQNKAWQDTGYPPIQMSVNVSMHQFRQRDFAKQLNDILEKTGLNPGYLDLELTESIIMQDADFTISVLKDLKSLGIHVSVDDFGTGYSSLNYLKLLPLNRLKLDRSFVSGITTDSNDLAICRAVIMMAHSLNLKVVAEGVENVEQLELLRSLGCDEAQGFLFCCPVLSEDFIKQVFSQPCAAL